MARRLQAYLHKNRAGTFTFRWRPPKAERDRFDRDAYEFSLGTKDRGEAWRRAAQATTMAHRLLAVLRTMPKPIDQPEENLDPKSVFDELVNLFIHAKSHRQVIIVTHNANLVINTDADQIIIAEAGPHPQGSLPPISYQSGGLENAAIRKAVCDILEGGEGAFQERARRLRVRLDR